MTIQPTIFTRYGGRTFIAFLCLLITGTLLQAIGQLTPVWVGFALGLKGMLTYRSLQQDKVKPGNGAVEAPNVGG